MTEQHLKDVMMVETGRNLLFLSAFLKPHSRTAQWKLSDALVAFYKVPEVAVMEDALRMKLDHLRSTFGEAKVVESLRFMVECVSRSAISNSQPILYDARYFYVSDGQSQPQSESAEPTHKRHQSRLFGHTIAHIVDRHVARLVRENSRPDLLTETAGSMASLNTLVIQSWWAPWWSRRCCRICRTTLCREEYCKTAST